MYFEQISKVEFLDYTYINPVGLCIYSKLAFFDIFTRN